MRTVLISLFLLVTLTTFGQKNIKKAWILRDGKEISYTEYKQIDPTQFAEINVIPGDKKHVRLFGKKSKKGIVHLKTKEFIENQKTLLDSLQTEFKSGGQETKMVVINGIPFDRTEKLDKIIINLKIEEIEWMFIPDSSYNTEMFFHNGKNIKVIQTNVDI
jgi:hypothetical protein